MLVKFVFAGGLPSGVRASKKAVPTIAVLRERACLQVVLLGEMAEGTVADLE
jgi:hypothetical protein